MMYDFHTHFVPEEVVDWIKENKNVIHAKWEKRVPGKEDFLVVDNKWAFELKILFTDADLYLKSQGEIGVTHSVVSPIPQLFLYDFEERITNEISTVYNEALADWVQANPEQLSALGTVPLNNPEQAAEELRKSMDKGLKGVIIGPGASGEMLTSDMFTPFWEEADRLGAIVFVHPLLNDDPRLKKKMMPNLIGVPWETTVCATDLLLSGHLDKYPDVKILLGHGGGFLPYQVGRLGKGYEQWKAVSGDLQQSPEEYLKRFWYDSVLWNDQTLDYLIKLVGEDQVVTGSDFPFDLCTWPPEFSGEQGAKKLLGMK